MTFTGAGATNAKAALASFDAAIPGPDNTTAIGPQTSGFRTINWDGVKLDGTDFGGGANTTVITPGKTVGIPLNRFQTRGVFFGQVYAVSGDGFVDVNPNVTGLFPAFSPSNTFAMFNDNAIDLSFILPSGNGSTPVPAATKGFGAIFLNVQADNSSSIEYFSGDKLLATVFVPKGSNPGDPEFAGALFPDAVVTRVTLHLGTDVLFTFDGKTASGTSMNTPPLHNLVVTDDFDYAEPVALNSAPPVLSGAQGTTNAQPVVNASVGTQFGGVVATFSDTAATVGPQNYTAVINWGDGHITNGAVVANGKGGFDVMGMNTYAIAGRVPYSVDVQKFDAAGTSISLSNTALVAQATSSTTLTVSSTTAIVGQPITLTAKVTGTATQTPGGSVEFKDGSTILGVATLDTTGTATLTTSGLTTGNHNLSASFLGNSNAFSTSDSSPVSISIQSDITSQVRITLGPVKRRRGGGFTQFVLLTNTGAVVSGPIFYVFDNLSSKVKVVGAAGVTMNQPPRNNPFVNVNIGPLNTFANGQGVGLNLVFKARLAKLVRYTPRVLAGITP